MLGHMTPDAVIAILRAHEAPLRRRGVTSAALFGSSARGETVPGSDIDIMVDIDPAAGVDVYGYVGITQWH
jgi:predicted nucleotidyltransferase